MHIKIVLEFIGIKYDEEKEVKAAEAAKQAELQRLEETKAKLSEKSKNLFTIIFFLIFFLSCC